MSRTKLPEWQKRLRKLIRGKSAAALARGVGLHHAVISRAARKGLAPQQRTAELIAEALGVDVGWLFRGVRLKSPKTHAGQWTEQPAASLADNATAVLTPYEIQLAIAEYVARRDVRSRMSEETGRTPR